MRQTTHGTINYMYTYIHKLIHTYIHTYIYLDLDVKMKSSVFGNKSLGTYSMGDRYTGTYIHTYVHTVHTYIQTNKHGHLGGGGVPV